MTSWLSLSLAETSGNEVGGHAKCAGWSWLPWSTVENRSGWRSNGQKDVNMCQKSLYSSCNCSATISFNIFIYQQQRWNVKLPEKERSKNHADNGRLHIYFEYRGQNDYFSDGTFCTITIFWYGFIIPSINELKQIMTSLTKQYIWSVLKETVIPQPARVLSLRSSAPPPLSSWPPP